MAASDTLPAPLLPHQRPLHAAPYPRFTCGWSASPGLASVRVTGECDRATTPQLERTLAQAQRHSRLVVLDLRGVEFMDSSGMNAVFDAHERALLAHGHLAVIRGPAQVDRLFELTGVGDVLQLVSLDPAEPSVQALLKISGGASHGTSAPESKDTPHHQPPPKSTWCPNRTGLRA